MNGTEITLDQMLARREQRASEQQNLLNKYHSPVISFSMNIPGPVKTNSLIQSAFEAGKKLILASIEKAGAKINHSIEIHEVTGDELLLSVDGIIPSELKDIAMKIESASKIGRLYDIDVIDTKGVKLSRKIFRKCLICDRQAQECARSRAHSVQEMQAAVELLLRHQTYPMPPQYP